MKKRIEENQKKSSSFCKNQMAKPLFSIQSDQKKIIRIEMVIEKKYMAVGQPQSTCRSNFNTDIIHLLGRDPGYTLDNISEM